jgi:hypothetical protein
MFTFTKRRALTILGVVAALAVAGAAIAYWTAGGSGDGTAATSNPTDQLTVNQTATLNAMHPGDSPQTLSGDFDNPTGNAVYVDTVTASIASVEKGGITAVGCDASDFDLQNAAMTVGHEVAAGSGQDSWSGATIQFKDKATNQDACKGVTVNLHYAIS